MERPHRWLSIAIALLGASLTACGDDEDGEQLVCVPNSQEACYEGPAETNGVGACREGLQSCSARGDAQTGCLGQITPDAEDCLTPSDDDCDGEINEGCACTPGVSGACYSGPSGSVGVGLCRTGMHTCEADGASFGPCEGEVVPGVEDCSTPEDDDCDGEANEADACACSAGESEPCYGGPSGTLGVGICVAGVHTCDDAGRAFGPCEGAIVPRAEDCSTPEDDDCDGASNEVETPCPCEPGDLAACYSGPTATLGVGLCEGGQQSCLASGDGFGPCAGETLPITESCGTPDDDDCDGTANEAAAGCECTPGELSGCYSGPPFTVGIGTCKQGLRTCDALGHWGPCEGEVVPTLEDCNTPFDESCDGAVNEPSAGCFCFFEELQSLQSEDCVGNYGESAWRKPIEQFPHRMGVDEAGNAYLLSRRELLVDEFEPVPGGFTPVALVGRYLPNGDLLWGKELTGSLAPPTAGVSYLYQMDVAPTGFVAFTAPASPGAASAFGAFDEWTWTAQTFRVLYSIDPWGFPYFAIAVPRYGSELNTAFHAIAATGDGGVFYMNGGPDSRLHKYDDWGDLVWTVQTGLSLPSVALAPTPDGGVVLSFTTAASVNLGTGVLPPIVPLQPDLIVARYDEDGAPLWVVRPGQAAEVHAVEVEDGVIALVVDDALVRFEAVAGALLSADPLPSSAIPESFFSLVGTGAVLYARDDAPAQDFGLGPLAPYGGQPSGDFIALREVGGTRWARAPLSDKLAVAGASPNVLMAAFASSTAIDLDGQLTTLLEPASFLARLSY